MRKYITYTMGLELVVRQGIQFRQFMVYLNEVAIARGEAKRSGTAWFVSNIETIAGEIPVEHITLLNDVDVLFIS